MNEPTEKDYLVYRGTKVPRFLRLFWTILFFFSAFYLISYALPDLKVWIGKVR